MRRTRRTNRGGGFRRVARGAVVALLALTATGCSLDEILEVDLPGRVPEDALDNPALAQTLVNGVISDFECAWANYVSGAVLISDQIIQSSGNLNQRNWGTRRITADDPNMAQVNCRSPYGIYTPMQTARYQAEDVYERLAGFAAGTVPNVTSLQATTRAYAGFALVALGEGFCEMALDGGPRMTPAQVLELAEQRFGEAIQLAQQAGNQDMLNLALVGRARVRLDLEDFDGAIDDASRVPAGYLKNASRDDSDIRRYNYICYYITCTDWKHASIAPNFRNLEFEGVPDPRVEVVTNGVLGFDNATIHWYPTGIARTRSEGMLLASGLEARLFIAEASARTGNLATAREIINELHAAAGLPAFDPGGTASQSQVIGHVIEERKRELFLQGAHRLNDHLRFRGTEWEIPFRGEPGSIHPDGSDQTGVPYGSTTCFPLPTVEVSGNPNV